MELCLVNNDSSNTLLVAEDGPRYEIDTTRVSPANTMTTTILRIEGELSTGHVGTVIGQVESCPTREARLQLYVHVANLELVLHPSSGPDSDNSWAFMGPDNRPYKWQIFLKAPVLILNDNSDTLLARYRRAKLGIVSRSRKAFLEILPAGLSAVDLIVVTFVSFMKQRVMVDYQHHTS